MDNTLFAMGAKCNASFTYHAEVCSGPLNAELLKEYKFHYLKILCRQGAEKKRVCRFGLSGLCNQDSVFAVYCSCNLL
jgi:hypothetical protein